MNVAGGYGDGEDGDERSRTHSSTNVSDRCSAEEKTGCSVHTARGGGAVSDTEAADGREGAGRRAKTCMRPRSSQVARRAGSQMATSRTPWSWPVSCAERV